MAGIQLPPWMQPQTPAPATPPKPTSVFGNPATSTAAANTQASDYDRIMKSYQDLLAKNSANPTKPSSITPQAVNPTTTQYQQSGDVTSSLSNLSNLATTGGYSQANIDDIRARDVSPIRSIYANAQRGLTRQRGLQSGYSPNYGAVQSKLARDESSQVGDVVTNANAGIAQNVASNRLAAASPYASASASASAAKTAVDQHNTDIINQINEANSAAKLNADSTNASNDLMSQLNNKNTDLNAIQGQTSLYGTTPALVSTFGNQVGQAANIDQGQQQLDQQKRRDNLGFIGSSARF